MSNYGFTTGASGYDDADRLKNWNRSDGGLDHSWDLSLVGDWNSQTENTQSTSFTHNNVHELTAVGSTPLAYDIKGNLTTNQNGHTYTWDFNNRMEGADTDSDSVDDLHFTYDAIGRRVSRNDGTTNTIFVSSGQQVIAEYASGALPTSPTEQYVYASYIDEPIIKIGTGGTLYYHRNRQYSIVALSDTTGNVVEQYAYTSTGVTTTLDATTNPIPTTTKNNPYTYTSRRLDPTLNLHYFRARWFDSQLGRFTNRDPLQYVDGMSLYRGYLLPNNLDHSGAWLRYVSSKRQGEKKCGEHIGQDWRLELEDEAPCSGWLVQKVEVYCEREECDACSCPPAWDKESIGASKPSVYYEAWYIFEKSIDPVHLTKGDPFRGFLRFSKTHDRFKSFAKQRTCGRVALKGVFKFFCENDLVISDRVRPIKGVGDLRDIWEGGTKTSKFNMKLDCGLTVNAGIFVCD